MNILHALKFSQNAAYVILPWCEKVSNCLASRVWVRSGISKHGQKPNVAESTIFVLVFSLRQTHDSIMKKAESISFSRGSQWYPSFGCVSLHLCEKCGPNLKGIYCCLLYIHSVISLKHCKISFF